MKRLARYFAWVFGGMGWFEWYMSTMWFFIGGGITAIVIDDKSLSNFMFGVAMALSVAGLVFFIGKGIRASWNRFKEDDEKVFNILKKDDIK